MKVLSKGALRWALYDWANSVFFTSVVAAFFPIFYAEYWDKGSPEADIIFRLAATTSIIGVISATLAPFLGAIADRSGAKQRFLGVCALIGIVATASLALLSAGTWTWALILFAVASVGCTLSVVISDSMITDVSTPKNVDFTSGFGFSLGYLGGGALFVANVVMILNAEKLGFPDKAAATRVAFFSVAVWWLIFSLPLVLGSRIGSPAAGLGWKQSVKKGLAELGGTFRSILRTPHLVWFLLAYWFYIDGVDTIITMAVAYGKILGVPSDSLILTIILIQFTAFPFALLAGWLGQKFGPRPIILLGLLIYLGVTFSAYKLDLEPLLVLGIPINKIYLLGFLIAMAQGGVQSLSRSLYSRLIPPSQSGAYFGVYNLLGRFAAILGPFMMGAVSKATDQPRLGILSVSVLFVIGGILLAKVRIPPPEPA